MPLTGHLALLGATGGADGAGAGAFASQFPPRVIVQEHDWRDFHSRDQIESWDALALRTSEPNPFYESWYLLPSLRELDPAGHVAMLAVQADGELVGLLPVLRTRDYYGHPIPHLRNWVHPNCFLGQPLVARGMEQTFWQGLLDWCDQESGFAFFLHLSHVPAHGPLRDALKAVLARQRRSAATVHREARAMLHSNLSAEDYFEAALPAKKRKELRRQHRRLQEHGQLTVERLSDYSDIAGWTREFLELEAGGWKGDAGSAMHCDPRTQAIFQAAIAGSAVRGRLERLAVRLNGRAIAMLATFITGRGAYSFKTAFDQEYARFSPGVLLQRENMALLEREGCEWADSCAAPDHPMIDHLWRERREIERISIGIGGFLRRSAFAAIIRMETGSGAGGLE